MSLLTVPSTYTFTSVVSPSVGSTTNVGAGLTWRVIGYLFEVTEPVTLTGIRCMDPTAWSTLGHAWITNAETGVSVSSTPATINSLAPFTYSLIPGVRYIASMGYKVGSTFYSQRNMEYDYGTPDSQVGNGSKLFTGEQFMRTPPPYIKYIKGTYIYSNDIEGAPTLASLIHPSQVTARVQLTLTRTESITLYTPQAPLIGTGIGQFNINLPTDWRIVDMKEWELQVSISKDNAVWSDWGTVGILPPTTISYGHSNIDTSKYYRYRYQVRTRVLESAWSGVAQAGAPTAGALAPVIPQQLPNGDVSVNTTGNITSTGGFVGRAVGAFNVYANTNTAVGVNNTWTQVTFQNETFDVNGWFSSSVYTPQVAGYYLIGGFVSASIGIGSGVALLVAVYKNGSQVSTVGTSTSQASLNPGAQGGGTTIVYMNGSTDYIDLRYYAASSGSWTMLNAIMYGHYIGTN